MCDLERMEFTKSYLPERHMNLNVEMILSELSVGNYTGTIPSCASFTNLG